MSPNLIVFLAFTPLAVVAVLGARACWVSYDSKGTRRRLERQHFRLEQLIDNAECQVALYKRHEKRREERTVPPLGERRNDPTWNRQRWDRKLFRLRQQIEEVEEAIAQLKQREAASTSGNGTAAVTVVHGSDGDDLEFNDTQVSTKEVRNGIGNE